MKALMLVAHGSRKTAANDEIRRLAQRVDELEANEFDAVLPAFLEFAEPDIHQAVQRCVELGAESIVAVPYFLAAGKHVAKDIPAELSCAQAGHPGIEIELSRYLGESEAMAALVLQSAAMPA